MLLLAALALAGCGGSGASKTTKVDHAAGSTPGAAEDGTVLYGSLPATGTPVKGGTVSFGELTDGGTPLEVFPMLSGPTTSTADFMLNAEMFVPLFNGPKGARPTVDYALSAADPPSFSDGDRTVTIPLKRNLKWSNGAPVVANDVLFYITLLKAAIKEGADNWSQYDPGEFPSSVTSMSAPNSHTVVLHLDKGYNPGYFVENQMEDTGGGPFPLPSTDWNIDRAGGPHLADWRNPAVARKIYNYLSKAGTALATFASNPLWRDVDGPFTLKTFSATNGSYTMTPNPGYRLAPKPSYSTLSVPSFTSPTAALNALRSGAVDVIGIDSSQLGAVAGLRSQGVRVFGAPSFGYAAAVINFKDRTHDYDHVIAQLYARQALAHLIDEPALIKGAYKGAAAPDYGPIPSAPASPYVPGAVSKPVYAYSPSAAAALLKAHGWKVVPGGRSTCARPGTGKGECGAGIPAGTPFEFTWVSAPDDVSSAEVIDAEAIASVAKQAGIQITVQIKSSNTISDNFDDVVPGDAKYENDWALTTTQPVALTDYYPTQAGFDLPGAYNLGDYDDPTANRLMEASVHSGDVHSVERESAYLTRNLPDLFLPNPDVLIAVAKGIGGPADSWTILSEGAAYTPQYWYRIK